MKRWLATLVVFAISSAAVRADVTIVQTITMEGGAAAMGGAPMSPTITNRIKGMKARMEMDLGMQSMITIADLVEKKVIVLRAEEKTAQLLDGPPQAADVPGGIKVDSSVKPTGKFQTIDGLKCDEYAITTTMSMGEVTGGQIPPEMAGMMKDLTMVMTGSMWVAKDGPGVAEYSAFQKTAAKSDLGAMISSAGKIPGMDRMLKAMSGIDGMAYLTEMNMSIDGTGQIADLLRQSGMGTMKLTAKVKSISADPLSDDLFRVPVGYTVIK